MELLQLLSITATSFLPESTFLAFTEDAVKPSSSNFFVSATKMVIDLVIRASGHNQIDEFTDRQALVQRILATSSSCASILLCLAAFYSFLAIDPRRLIFRHQLIFFLLSFDMLKAVILLLYPTRVLTHSSSYYNDQFCQVVGFFTATAIEGADIAILAFAVHTYLLIFKPSLSTKVKNSTRTEGGLYKFRFYVYVMSFLIPLVLASLAFVNGTGYISLVCWCYLPQRPVWYRFVLSWVPRYCIVVIIFVFYALIYYHVIREFKTLGGVFTTMHKSQGNVHPKLADDEKPGLYSALKYFLSLIKDTAMPKFVFPTEELTPLNTRQMHEDPRHKNENDDDEEDVSDLSSTPPVHVDTENIVYDPELHAANLESFRKRQKIIQKQMKSIFVYPFAYCFLWLFPFILHITQVNYEERHGPIYWINCMGAFFQPFNGFVDALVFFYREQPWNYTIMKNYEKEHTTRMNSMMLHPMHHASQASPHHFQSIGSESITTSARLTKNSDSITAGLIDLLQYPFYRRWLNDLHFPLFALPTEENIIKLQNKFIQDRNNNRSAVTVDEQAHEKLVDAGIVSSLNKTHDYSNILSGDLNEGDFRKNLNLHNFKLNFDGSKSRSSSLYKRSSLTGGLSTNSGRRGSVISSLKSSRSQRINLDVTDPIVREDGRRMSLGTTMMMTAYHPPINEPNNLELKPFKKTSHSGSPHSSNGKKSYASTTRNSNSGSATTDPNDEIDFIEFLKKGPH